MVSVSCAEPGIPKCIPHDFLSAFFILFRYIFLIQLWFGHCWGKCSKIALNILKLLHLPVHTKFCVYRVWHVRKIQVWEEFWAALNELSETALQLAYSPAHTAQDEAALYPKGTLLAHVQIICQVGALCPSVLPGKGNKIHAFFTHFAWHSLSSTSPKSNSLLFSWWWVPSSRNKLKALSMQLCCQIFFYYIWTLPKSFLFLSGKKIVLPEPVLNREHSIWCYCAQTFGFVLRTQHPAWFFFCMSQRNCRVSVGFI